MVGIFPYSYPDERARVEAAGAPAPGSLIAGTPLAELIDEALRERQRDEEQAEYRERGDFIAAKLEEFLEHHIAMEIRRITPDGATQEVWLSDAKAFFDWARKHRLWYRPASGSVVAFYLTDMFLTTEDIRRVERTARAIQYIYDIGGMYSDPVPIRAALAFCHDVLAELGDDGGGTPLPRPKRTNGAAVVHETPPLAASGTAFPETGKEV